MLAVRAEPERAQFDHEPTSRGWPGWPCSGPGFARSPIRCLPCGQRVSRGRNAATAVDRPATATGRYRCKADVSFGGWGVTDPADKVATWVIWIGTLALSQVVRHSSMSARHPSLSMWYGFVCLRPAPSSAVFFKVASCCFAPPSQASAKRTHDHNVRSVACRELSSDSV